MKDTKPPEPLVAPPLSTGNAIVDRVTTMHFEGNIVDHRWRIHPLLKYPNGKLNGTALDVLADLVYWFRAAIERDPITNQVIAIRKKFPEQEFWKDYQSWADSLGLTKRQLQDAVSFLVKVGLVRRAVGPVTLRNSTQTNNVPIIELVPEMLHFITYGVTMPKAATSPRPAPQRDTPHVETRGPTRRNVKPHAPQRETVQENIGDQQETTTNSIVVAENSDEFKRLFALLEKELVSPDVAEKLIREFPERIEQQVNWLPFRDGLKNPAASLVTAIKKNWSPPARWIERQRRDDEAAQEKIERQAQAKAAQEKKLREAEELRRREDENDALDLHFKSLPAKERKEIDGQVSDALGRLSKNGMGSDNARAALRRNILRKELGLQVEEIGD
jgi:hypothetical protein